MCLGFVGDTRVASRPRILEKQELEQCPIINMQ